MVVFSSSSEIGKGIKFLKRDGKLYKRGNNLIREEVINTFNCIFFNQFAM